MSIGCGFATTYAQNLLPNGNLEQKCGLTQGKNCAYKQEISKLPDCCNANYLNYWESFVNVNPYNCGNKQIWVSSGLQVPLYIDTNLYNLDFNTFALHNDFKKLKPINGSAYFYIPVKILGALNCKDSSYGAYHYIGFNVPFLKSKIEYEFSFFYNGKFQRKSVLPNQSNPFHFSDGLGFGLYNTPPDVNGNYANPIPKQKFKLTSVGIDTVWKQAKWNFIADSNYKLLVIGNFWNWYENKYLPFNAGTDYYPAFYNYKDYSYAIDSLVLQPKGNLLPTIVHNDTICGGKPFLFKNLANDACAWEINGNVLDIDTTYLFTPTSNFTIKAWNSAGSWQKQIVVVPYTKPSVSQDQVWCKNTIRLSVSDAANKYRWMPEMSSAMFIDVLDTLNRVLYIENGHCKDTLVVKIEYGCKPQLKYTPDTPCVGEMVKFFNESDKRPLKYYVNGVYFGTVTQMEYRAAENLTVKIENKYGTDEQTLLNVKNCDDVKIYVPTGLVINSPINPIFKPFVFNGLLDAKLEIFNCWGSKIYSTDNALNGWNPSANNMYKNGEIYVWQIKGKSTNTSGETKIVNLSGTVSVVR